MIITFAGFVELKRNKILSALVRLHHSTIHFIWVLSFLYRFKGSCMFQKAWQMKLLLNIWPPFFFTGIRIVNISDDFRTAKVRLKLSIFNQNAVGVHFGGSLYAMTDPFCMLMIMSRLGKDYIVWDKSADIDYIKPGKGTVTAEFVITDALITDILANTAQGEKYLPVIPVYVKDEQGEIVAKLNRTLYIRKKRAQ